MKKIVFFSCVLAALTLFALLSGAALADGDITYHVNVSAEPEEGGTVNGLNETGEYEQLASFILTAEPGVGYEFVSWTENGEVISTEARTGFSAYGDRNITANFAPISYEITVTSSDPEMGAVSGGGSYEYGSGVTLSAVPNEGYYFVGWMEDGKCLNRLPGYSFTASSDRTLTGVFREKVFTVTLDPGEGGGDPRVYCSDGSVIADDYAGAGNCQFYQSDHLSGTYSFKFDLHCPFAPPIGMVFDGWEDSAGKLITWPSLLLFDADTVLTATWRTEGELPRFIWIPYGQNDTVAFEIDLMNEVTEVDPVCSLHSNGSGRIGFSGYFTDIDFFSKELHIYITKNSWEEAEPGFYTGYITESDDSEVEFLIYIATVVPEPVAGEPAPTLPPEMTPEPELAETPEPAGTPEPTETPEPTSTPVPEKTPAPTVKPTNTPAATKAPTATATPQVKTKTEPDTGDETLIAPWIFLSLSCGVGIAVLSSRRKRRD